MSFSSSVGGGTDVTSLKDMSIINAFDFPLPVWNATRASYHAEVAPARAVSGAGGTYHDDGSARISVFRDRLVMVRQRLLRSADYVSSSGGSGSLQGIELVSIDSLLGNPGRKCAIGVLTQLEEGVWYLEDESNRSVRLSLDSAVFSAGLFTEAAIVIATGSYSDADSQFEVTSARLPPPEVRTQSLRVLGSVDLFAPRIQLGDLSSRSSAAAPKARKRGRASKYAGKIAAADGHELSSSQSARQRIPDDAEFVVLSDVHLDNPEVLGKLRSLFDEYAEDPPALVVMFGNFLAREERHEGRSTLAASAMLEGFTALAELLGSFSRIARNTQFVFIPGPEDGGHTANVLPHHPLPRIFTAPLREKLRHVHFGTNPCRVRYFGVDITLFREDLVTKLRRNARVPHATGPAEMAEQRVVSSDVIQTVVDEGHLCPLPLSIRPFAARYDHCMWLYPLPDVIICADSFDAYEHDYCECTALNPGSFASDFSFVLLSPADLGNEGDGEFASFCRA